MFKFLIKKNKNNNIFNSKKKKKFQKFILNFLEKKKIIIFILVNIYNNKCYKINLKIIIKEIFKISGLKSNKFMVYNILVYKNFFIIINDFLSNVLRFE